MPNQFTLLSLAGFAIQLGVIFWVYRRCNGRALESVVFWHLVFLFTFHGMTLFWVQLSSAISYRAYEGITVAASSQAHVLAGLQMLAIAAGFILARRIANDSRTTPKARPSASRAVLWALFAILLVVDTGLSGTFFSRTADDLINHSYLASMASYMLYSALAIAAAASIARLRGHPFARASVILGVALIALLTGRRGSFIATVLSLHISLVYLKVFSSRAQRHTLVILAGLGIAAIVFLPIRQALETVERTDLIGLASEGFEASAKASTWGSVEDILDDLGYRMDAHVFLAHVVQAYNDNQDPLGVLSLIEASAFLIPNALWDSKTDVASYIEDAATAAYGMPRVDYTPTMSDEIVAAMGPTWALCLLAGLGFCLGRVEAVLMASRPWMYVLFVCTVGQALIQVESGLVGTGVAVRTMCFYVLATMSHRIITSGDTRPIGRIVAQPTRGVLYKTASRHRFRNVE